MQKINFKQLKYVGPAIAFPFVLFIGYMIFDSINKIPSDEPETVEKSHFNTDLPDISVDKDGIKNKFQAMLDNYGNVTDRTAVDGVEKEENVDSASNRIVSVYSDEEKRELDSIRQAKEQQLEKLQRQADALRYGSPDSEERVNVDDERFRDNPDLDPNTIRLIKQMELMQRVANGERILTEEEKLEEKRKQEIAQARQQILDSIAEANKPLRVNKADNANEQYFNSVQNKEERPGMIKARVDELVKVKDGSRIRIRISEDVEIDGEVLPKGSYLYAQVNGFSAQRVKASISSVVLNGRIKRVDLNVYDVDGIEGFFVPQSSFREMARDIGGAALSGVNVNMNSAGEQNLQSIAMQSLQQAFQSTTAAVTKKIRQNKAKLKYNTVVYLVNRDDIN